MPLEKDTQGNVKPHKQVINGLAEEEGLHSELDPSREHIVPAKRLQQRLLSGYLQGLIEK
jgi:hypothetical protein